MKGKKLLALVLGLLMVIATLTACGASTGASMDAAAPEQMQEAVEENGSTVLGSSTTADSGTGADLSADQKLIRTVHIDAETEDLETMLSQLTEQIGTLGGYIENQEIYNGSSYSHYRYRSASLTIRIPAEDLDGFVGQVKGISNVINYTEGAEDVTLTYVATESRVMALETEQERLLELLAKAENMTDLLEIEERLTEVRYELERVASQLRVLSNQVSYATVYLNIDQVEVYTETEEPTVWERITGGFTENLEDIGEGLVDFFVWAVTYSPQLLFWAIVIAVAVTIGRRTAKKRRNAKNPPVQDDPEKK